MLEIKLPKSMYSVFSKDVVRFVEQLHKFYNSQEFNFYNHSNKIHIDSLEDLAAQLSKLSENQDEIISMLEKLNTLPPQVRLPIEECDLLYYPDEIIKLAKNKDSIYNLFNELAEQNHKLVENTNDKFFLCYTDNTILLSQHKETVIDLLNDLRKRNLSYAFYGHKGIFSNDRSNSENVLRFAGKKQKLLDLIEKMRQEGYKEEEGPFSSYDKNTATPCYLYVDSLEKMAEHEPSLIRLLRVAKREEKNHHGGFGQACYDHVIWYVHHKREEFSQICRNEKLISELERIAEIPFIQETPPHIVRTESDRDLMYKNLFNY